MATSNKIKDLNLTSFQYTQVAAPLMRDLCAPLFKSFNITTFAYIRSYLDGRMLHLSTNADWEKLFFENQFYNEQDCFHKVRTSTVLKEFRKFILSGQPVGNHCEALHSFNIWNTFSVYQKQKDYIEGWAFGTTRDHTQIVDLYINESNCLQKFILYFNENTKDIVDCSNQYKLIKTVHNLSYEAEKNKDGQGVAEFLENIKINKFSIPTKDGTKFLSKREAQCLAMLCEGGASKDIALKLGLSLRTVEDYINRIKNKTNCRYKNQMINTYHQYISNWLIGHGLESNLPISRGSNLY